jgi:hypothetical protein
VHQQVMAAIEGWLMKQPARCAAHESTEPLTAAR